MTTEAANGRERCAPRSAGADARGCVKGLPVACPVNQVCTEEHGMPGLDTAVPATARPACRHCGVDGAFRSLSEYFPWPRPRQIPLRQGGADEVG